MQEELGYGALMRRICVLLSFVALFATTLIVPAAGSAGAHGVTQAIEATTPSNTAALAYHLRRGRSDARVGFRPALGFLSTALEGPITFSPHTGQDRTCCVVLLDGSDRWRSLLLGAPPFFA
jgi:hypothetical protein